MTMTQVNIASKCKGKDKSTLDKDLLGALAIINARLISRRPVARSLTKEKLKHHFKSNWGKSEECM